MAKKDIIIGFIMVLLGVFFRLIPHPNNFTPVIAIALLSGDYFSSNFSKFLVPILSMIISDFFIGFYEGVWVTYLSILTAVGIGTLISLKKFQVSQTFVAASSASFVFFFLTNLGVWAFSDMYAKDWKGLLECYTMAIPFFQNAIIGDSIYSIIFFGAFHLFQKNALFKTAL